MPDRRRRGVPDPVAVREAARRAGYAPGQPLVVALSRRDAPPLLVCQGDVVAGEPVTVNTTVYAASLSKQVVAAAAALLVARGRLDLDGKLSHLLPELPGWADAVRLRHLIHHVGGLPSDDQIDRDLPGDRTITAVLAALASRPAARPPGTAFEYANAGYVCLAEAVRRAAGRDLPGFAQDELFGPLGMTGTCFWDGLEPAPPGARPLHPAPLSLGDGGMWSTAADLLRWADALNDDVLGLRTRLQAPGRLDDGTELDYAWGMGVRRRASVTLYRHGGGWPGVRTMLVRAPDPGFSLVVLAPGDRTDGYVTLTDLLLDLMLR